MKYFERRKVETMIVNVSHKGKPTDALSVLSRMEVFTTLVMRHRVEFVTSQATSVTLRGQRRRLMAFKKEFDLLSRLGLV